MDGIKPGEWQIYEIDWDAPGNPKPFTTGAGGKFNPRCPASDSIEARDKLEELGREVELLLYEEEGHSFLENRRGN